MGDDEKYQSYVKVKDALYLEHALGKLFWAMIYPAEYSQIVVVKMCVLQITCCHILNEEQGEVPLSQAIVFIMPELNKEECVQLQWRS